MREVGTISNLEEKAEKVRGDIIKMLFRAQAGHCGGALSAVEIIIALYYSIMRIDPKRPQWVDRDRFVLSKGHGCLALYAVLADKGYFPRESLASFDTVGSILQGHPDMLKTPGVDMSTGLLGQGLSVGVGMALGVRLDKKECRIYVLLGDGELQSGQIWEAAMAAGHYKLDNLTAIVDRNGLQIVGPTENTMSLEPLSSKWSDFGWNVLEIDGHNIKQIINALKLASTKKDKPTIIIANTIKGKGVSFMEGKAEWHSKCVTEEEMRKALNELGVREG